MTPASVLIIGAGFSGLGTAIRLLQAGIDDIVVLERADRIGGTWRDNTYPGAACDIPSLLYSYSFAPNPDWSHTYAGGAEILAYLQEVADSHGLGKHVTFDAEVTGLAFDEAAGSWTATTADGRDFTARTVVMATGPLADVHLPRLPGVDDYTGHLVHSARWDHDHDMTAEQVAVVGTGASAVQIIPELVGAAAGVTVFQRTPGWVLPRLRHRRSAASRKVFRALPAVQRAARNAWYWLHESVALALVWVSPFTLLVEAAARLHLRCAVRDPRLRRRLTPDFRAGCKRILMSNAYYPALQASNCTLVTESIAALSPDGIRTTDGVERHFDRIVFATGFDVHKTGTPFPIIGCDGRVLADEWTRGARAYKSVNVAGYPNLFFTCGPNSGPGHNSLLVYAEAQIGYITRAIRMILRRDLLHLDVKPHAQDTYNRRIQRCLARTTWNSGCRSWYLTDDGFNATMYPGFATQYERQMARMDLRAYHLRPRVGEEPGGRWSAAGAEACGVAD
ncbi:flavin-containing monooxygenase [Actinomadura hibisca]|uniref:flavin-containing monooxygenase n=1 Tax=Actinomadura hibisca TaxID=68565 RepID=UPI00082CDD3C|nr:NAD(P)/FAD-dependent oxidoreductase [Actinomadura hibisca]